MLKLGFGSSPIAAIKGSTAHLKLTAYPSDPYVIPGTRFSVAVEPNAGIHVYAPGAEAMGYRVVSLNLAPTLHVRFEPVDFPASEIYYFAPLDERVPVYQSPFTYAAGGGRGGNPGSRGGGSRLPLSFTLDLELLDYQRANR